MSPSPSPSPSPTPSAPPEREPAAAPAPSDSGADRVSGSDRIETAAAVTATRFPGPVPTVYVTTAWAYADALGGGAAAAYVDAPILLTSAHELPQATRTELDRLQPAQVVILGGAGAVSPVVAAQIAASGSQVTRRSGPDRYATAAALSAATFPANVPVAYIGTGEGFADALSGASAAAHLGGPLLLVRPGEIPDVVAAELRRLAPARITVLGGHGAVSEAVQQQLGDYTAGAVERRHGPDRYTTSAQVVADAFPSEVDTVYLASGAAFADALAAVPAAARGNAPLLLVAPDHLPDAIAAQLRRLNAGQAVILGGPAAISPDVMNAIEATLRR